MNDVRNIVVTGVSRGLGRAMAAGFVQRGHRVFGCARNTQAIAALRDTWPNPHRFDVVDVSIDTQVKEWAKRVIDEAGPPDLLINSAALINEDAPLWQVPAEEFAQLVDVNIKGVVNVIRHFVPAMAEQGRGTIVNFSSGWGRSVSAGFAPYCATKWAIEGLTGALAEDLPPPMAAVSLNPGIINTDMLQSCFGESAHSFPGPERWASAAVPFLLSLGPQHNGEQTEIPG